MSRGIIEKLARFFHEHFSLDHDKEHPNWPKGGCQVCISAAHEFLPILAQEREKVRGTICKSLCYSCELAVRQLDLTKDLAVSSREEKEET